MSYRCIGCDSERVSNLGRLPLFTPDHLGEALNEGVDAGSMYRCLDCLLQFRAPAATSEVLANYYTGLSGNECWQNEHDREVWQEIKKVLEQAPERSILDVGCFRGDLLSYLGDSWQRFGIEPSRDARRSAEERGIKIISEDVESLPEGAPQFGAITLVDVIEHLLQPLESLNKLARLLKPGGQLIIFTGNTKAWSWRFAGLHYWYSAMPEHVAFFCPEWFAWAAPKLACRVTSVQRLCYEPAGSGKRMDETLKNTAYVAYRRFESLPVFRQLLPRLPVIKRIGAWESCWWTSARDHMLVVLTKDS